MRIKGFGRNDSMSYYRIVQPFDELAKHGHETSHEPGTTESKVGNADVAVGHMIGHTRWWRNLRKDVPLVNELDDDPFEVERINPAYSVYGDPLCQDSILFCIQAADLVTTSVEPLAERMRDLNPNVVVLKNRIDEALLGIERIRNERLTIGWAGGASHAFDIDECVYGIRKTLDRNPNVDCHFIGADFRFLLAPGHDVTRLRWPIRFTDWSPTVMGYYRKIDFDIGLAPLKPTRFAETKSAIKALEYAALGIPVIASDTRPYQDFVIDGVTGWLVRREHEWGARLRDLIHDEAMRTEMGRKAKEVAREWTIQKHWQEWESAYKAVL